ncbi:MAG: O-antigen ligase family protein [Planctomycetota bacterium]|jgi:putative inorganic carbon (HCO3(-)) transporter
MSATAIAWLISYCYLMLRGLSKPVFVLCAYLLTFYAAPQFWWWGTPLTSIRWNLVTAIALVVISLLLRSDESKLLGGDKLFMGLLLLYIFNAWAVNNYLANEPVKSNKEFDILWKGVVTAIVARLSIHSLKDLNIAFMAIMALTFWVSYEVYFNGAGKMIHGRLEGLRFPGASQSNGTAILVSMALPIIGYFFIVNPFRYSRWIAFGFAPFILNVVLLCNSRGTYLGLAASGLVLIFLARGKSRKHAMLIALGGIAAFLFLARSEQIWNRLFSINATAEERDGSAQSRINFTKAGIQMIADHPLGSGGGAAFYSPLGFSYIAPFGQPHPRAAHNGYVNIAAGWGVQGFLLLISAIFVSATSTVLSMLRLDPSRHEKTNFLGACILAAIFGQLVSTAFGDYLDGEWFLWLAAFGLAYSSAIDRLLQAERETEIEESQEYLENDSPDELWDSPLDPEDRYSDRNPVFTQ